MRSIVIAAIAALAASCAADAAETALADGTYEVTYRLDLPHLENHDEKTATICLTAIGAADGPAFPVLSANNPLTRCPVTNVRRAGEDLSFEIACPGGNAAKAMGLFSLLGDRFQGAITMNMGGKNMTMTEVQRGRRVGGCPAGAAPSPR